MIWIIFTLSVEIPHFLGFLILTLFTLEQLKEGDLVSFLEVLLNNLLVNLCPIFAQKYNRFRVLNIFDLSRSDLANFELEL